MEKPFDCIVIGAGHAGSEAALAAAGMGLRVAIITMDAERVALMPCNPSIGGIGKGHLVKEIDALGGWMARLADETLIQIKMLNRSKGPAVQALRAQIDKRKYGAKMAKLLLRAGISRIPGTVSGIKKEGTGILGVELEDGRGHRSSVVILTTGTFLNGRLVIGDTEIAGGRMGEAPARALSGSLKELGFELGRLQTATPPRLDGRSVDYSKMEIQPGDPGPLSFSGSSKPRKTPNIPCFLTYTNEATHKKLLGLMHLSPIKTGIIESRGPRNCPSIDRKVVNFPEKARHPVFIEPEGLETNEVYLQGLTTALPAKAQLEVVRSTPGLERAKMVRPGYAVEYDYVIASQLKPNLETKLVDGLFMAGQVVGTTGYEEAAALGLLAGINAALKVKGKPPLVLERSQAYMGVLVDDLVTKEHAEPYRMYTSRAEHRLILRGDNADLRLSKIGHELGLISKERMELVERKRRAILVETAGLKSTRLVPSQANNEALRALKSSGIKRPTSLAEILRRPEVCHDELEASFPKLYEDFRKGEKVSADAKKIVETEIKYEGYTKRQMEQVKRQKKMEERLIPEGTDFHELHGLSFRAREGLARVGPRSLGQATRVPGVTPADALALLIHLERKKRSADE
ncbi:MAG: tRNA uridine-5-carboxymethylaminomethyl(34) synthesis enzyme MnmG [Actinomycetota bacterium]|nr:tRNA uridine-5-carboxymethylaminomethyl(34) synthesis enzyme MnmG [Actinomycetota bacterium]